MPVDYAIAVLKRKRTDRSAYDPAIAAQDASEPITVPEALARLLAEFGTRFTLCGRRRPTKRGPNLHHAILRSAAEVPASANDFLFSYNRSRLLAIETVLTTLMHSSLPLRIYSCQCCAQSSRSSPREAMISSLNGARECDTVSNPATRRASDVPVVHYRACHPLCPPPLRLVQVQCRDALLLSDPRAGFADDCPLILRFKV